VLTTGAQVLPAFIDGANTRWFYAAGCVHPALRTALLARELLNKRGRAFSLTVGPLIAAEALDGDPIEVTERLKAHVEQGLAADPDRTFA